MVYVIMQMVYVIMPYPDSLHKITIKTIFVKHVELLLKAENNEQTRIQNPVKYLRWSIL